jgi:Ser-tRNA(Ala) deacylase AlaX
MSAEQLSPTELVYLLDSYQFHLEQALVLSVSDTEIVLDRTIFHAQGGGQPSDVGTIVSRSNSDAVFEVRSGLKDSHTSGIVKHLGVFQNDARFSVGESVSVHIDESKRRTFARLHSAGHLIDVAMERVGYPLKAGKGSHTPDMTFVEYVGTIDNAEMETARLKLQAMVDTVIGEARSVSAVVVPYDQLQAKCGFVPDYLPADQPTRIIEIDGFVACPCGGTHVKSTADLGGVRIVALKNNKKNLRVKYELV